MQEIKTKGYKKTTAAIFSILKNLRIFFSHMLKYNISVANVTNQSQFGFKLFAAFFPGLIKCKVESQCGHFI